MSTIPEFGAELSVREIELLTIMADEGATAKDAGRKLGISHRTVEVHTRNFIVKLGARNLAHALVTWERSRIAKRISDLDCAHRCGVGAEIAAHICGVESPVVRSATAVFHITRALVLLEQFERKDDLLRDHLNAARDSLRALPAGVQGGGDA